MGIFFSRGVEKKSRRQSRWIVLDKLNLNNMKNFSLFACEMFVKLKMVELRPAKVRLSIITYLISANEKEKKGS